MNEEQREKANRLGYDRLEEPPEGVGEEQKEKPTVERISDALQLTGILVLITSVPVGIWFVIDQEESTGSLFTVWGFGFLAWFFCRAARYILVDVTSDMRNEKPNVVGRIGQVIYWLGCAVGILSMPAGVLAWVSEIRKDYYDDAISALFLCLAIGAAAWLVGRGARYILKGD